MDYTVTIRDKADNDKLEAWAIEEFRDPTGQLNAAIRQMLRQRGTTTPDKPRAPRQRRQADQSTYNGTVQAGAGV